MARLDRHILCTLVAQLGLRTEDAWRRRGRGRFRRHSGGCGYSHAGIVDSGAPVDAGAPPERFGLDP